jgi:iron complex transport system substrate-binding protein
MKKLWESRVKHRLFKVLSVLAASMLVAIVIVGCSSENAPGAITDHAGRQLNVSEIPNRIVSLIPSHTEIVFALGLGDKVVAVDDYSDYPPAATSKAKVGSTLSGLSTEAIVIAEPDLILADISAVELGVVDTLTKLLPKTVVVVVKGTSVASFQDVYESIELIGKVTGASKNAEQIISDMKARVKAVTDKTGGLTTANKPRTVYIIWPEPMYVYGGHAIGSALIEAAGGVNIFAENQGDAVQLEELISRNPQIILASASEAMGDYAYQFALTDTRLDTTEAKINGAIYGMNDDFTGRPGPRLVEGLEQMAKLLHPELFT